MRHRFKTALALLPVLALIIGGCPGLFPTTSNPATSGSPASGGNSGSSSSGSSGGSSSSGGGQSFADQLTQQFPDCLEPNEAAQWRAEVLQLVNQERARAGLNPVTHNQTLEDQATQYACEMIHYHFFDHVNPVTGSTLAERAADFGYNYRMIGENLAAGQSSPQEVMQQWMNSPGHRANILNPDFTELGVGVRTGGDYGIYWVQEFGQPMP